MLQEVPKSLKCACLYSFLILFVTIILNDSNIDICYHVTRQTLEYCRMYLYCPVWGRLKHSETGSSKNLPVFASRPHSLGTFPAEKKKKKGQTHTMKTLASPCFMVGMLWDEWWDMPGFPQTQHFSFHLKLNWGLVSSDRTIFCLTISFMCLYGHFMATALLHIFSGVASFWPLCHLTQICDEFHWLLSFQEDSARAVRGAFLWPKFIFGSSLEVSQCG